ncbi:uncharacterized protein [Venturia canescens]|uniref:uncharacterized protein n=1 Tax=Venturia canescens TaxID=32260 RepID=UPI001C9D076B|nr:uncharacterized protein LOC122412289 [Venturia canescens]
MKGVFIAYFVALLSCVWLQANGVAESREISEMIYQGDTPSQDISDANRIPDPSCYQESCSYGEDGCEHKYKRTCEMEEPRCIEGPAGYKKGDPSKSFPACCPKVICNDAPRLSWTRL